MNDELPQGWAEITLQGAGTWRTGGTPSRRRPEFFGKGIPWVKSGDLPDGPILKTEEEITELGLENSSAKLMPTGTISMALYGATIGKLGFMTFPAATNQACANAIPDMRFVEAKYLFYYLFSERRNFIEQGQGGAQPNISQEIVRSHPFRLAPLAEQRRIVAKLEKLLGKVDACQQRLAKIPGLLKRFRQSVLAAVCSGRLTADWREKNPNSQEWKTVGLVELSERIQIGPFGTQLHKADYVSNGVPLINPTHIQSSKIIHDPDFTVSKTKLRELENYVLQENDIIMGRRGEMARCALVSENESGWLCGTGSLFVRPKSTVCPAFLFLVLRSPETKAFLEGESKGTTMSNLNLEILKSVPVSISSLPEQQEIVRRVESLFALADQLEARYAKAKAHVEKLTPSLLARAFRGELVPQDPNDEPASILLERIKQTKPKDQPKQKTKRATLAAEGALYPA